MSPAPGHLECRRSCGRFVFRYSNDTPATLEARARDRGWLLFDNAALCNCCRRRADALADT